MSLAVDQASTSLFHPSEQIISKSSPPKGQTGIKRVAKFDLTGSFCHTRIKWYDDGPNSTMSEKFCTQSTTSDLFQSSSLSGKNLRFPIRNSHQPVLWFIWHFRLWVIFRLSENNNKKISSFNNKCCGQLHRQGSLPSNSLKTQQPQPKFYSLI